MKVLFIQLTRIGDVLCTLPVLKAYRRKNPQAEIHLLVRSKFSDAVVDMSAIDRMWSLDSQYVLGPVLDENIQTQESVRRLRSFVNELHVEKFDKVINLSFSPSSSFLTHLIAGEDAQIAGYSRTSDFYLHIPDSASRYFRAQVGVEKSNRLHVIDLMSWVAGVGSIQSDIQVVEREQDPSGIVCHIGASVSDKCWSGPSWEGLLSRLIEFTNEPIILAGSKNEGSLANRLESRFAHRERIANLVGKTSLSELLSLLRAAKLFIGADSGPLHLASLAGCKSLNLSVGPVRFWETGPLVPESRILIRDDPFLLLSDEVFMHSAEMLQGKRSSTGCAVAVDRIGVRYDILPRTPVRSDAWALVEWLCFEAPSPVWGGQIQPALAQIIELCDLANSQLGVYEGDPARSEPVKILDRVDELLGLVRRAILPLQPLLDQFFVHKENIPPGTRQEVIDETRRCYGFLLRHARELQTPGELTKGQDL